jgi:hypothetical protein
MYNSGSTRLKYFKRLKIYKNSTNTVSFNPETMDGYSYNWNFLAKVEGVLIFNDYTWSVTTSCHQSAVSSLLRELNIKYVRVDLGSISPTELTKDTVKKLYAQLFRLQIKIEESRKGTGAYNHRVYCAQELMKNIEKVESISKKFKVSKKDQNEIMKNEIEKRMVELNETHCDRVFKQLSLDRAEQDLNPIEL